MNRSLQRFPKFFHTPARSIKSISEIPGPKGLPYFGTYFKYKFGQWPVDDYHLTLNKLRDKYGNIVREERCGETVIHVFDPEDAKAIFAADGRNPYIKPLMETTQVYRNQKKMSPGLGNTNGEPWTRLRTAVSPLLMRPESLTNRTLPIIDETVNDAIKWFVKINNESGEISDLEKRIPLWQMESGARVVTRKSPGFFNSPDFGYQMYQANRDVFRLTAKMKHSLPIYRYVPFLCPNFRKLSIQEDVVFGTGQKWLDQAWSKYFELAQRDEKLAAEKFSVLHYLHCRDDISIPERNIIALSIMFDGLSTTTPTVLALLYCFAMNPAAQEKASDEARKALMIKNGELNYDILGSHLTLIRACLKEAMRLFTITTDISRIAQREIVVGGYRFPKGTVIDINTHSLFRDPGFIPSPPSPDDFAPQRWIKEEKMKQPHPFLVLPFGHGARMCAGRRFAEIEMLAFTVRLLAKYRLTWTGDKQLQQTYETLLYPKGNVAMSLSKRD